MNPPPSYQEVLKMLNKSNLTEMKLINENADLTKELENVKLELKLKSDELELFRKGYELSKRTEYKLEKLISKL
jgi:hypothetical protein